MKIRFHFIIILITISVLSLAQQNEAFRVSYSGLELNFGLWLELEVTGIAVYKEHIQPVLNRSVPFFPLGMPFITDDFSPIALGLETGDKKFVSVWRLQGRSEVIIQGMAADNPVILYLDLGIKNSD